MTSSYTHINETGINLLSGKPATENEKFVATYYSPVKAGSNVLPFVVLLVSEPTVGEYPYTGRGFTGSKNIVLPEFEIPEQIAYRYVEGDTITIYNSYTGEPIQKYGYTKQNGWIELTP